jgi:predicted 3-demethylubiquinone-9 3-methyltransferase (glyoxalase superfamily)
VKGGKVADIQKITPFLWFENQAEEAARHHTSYFWIQRSNPSRATVILDPGRKAVCGWLKDKYGLCWQIVPTALIRMLKDQNPQKSQRVMQAMMQMKKIDIPALEAAYSQQS